MKIIVEAYNESENDMCDWYRDQIKLLHKLWNIKHNTETTYKEKFTINNNKEDLYDEMDRIVDKSGGCVRDENGHIIWTKKNGLT